MSETLTEIERKWAHEAGITCDVVERDITTGEAGVWRTCGRCGGEGRIWCFGHVEAGICFGCRGRKRFFRTLRKMATNARAKARRDAKAAIERREAPRRAAREARALLAEHEGLAVALRAAATDGFVRDLARQLARKGRLTERQIEAAFRAAEREAAKPAEVEIEAGRRELTGTIVSLKSVETDFGICERMLVEIEPGARIFGTVPSILLAHTNEELKGRRVRFTAMVEPKEPGFGFFKRPTKAEIIEEGESDEA